MHETQEDYYENLRRKAQARLNDLDLDSSAIPDDLNEMLRELEVHREELKIQNEELKGANRKISELHAEYSNLYEFAPVGYVALSPRGIITRSNLKAVELLDEEREILYHSRFGRFATRETEKAFIETLARVKEYGVQESVELEIRGREEGSGKDPLWIRTDVLADYSDAGELVQWRLTLVDISRRKRSEEELQDRAQQLDAIYTYTPVLMFLLDEERRIRKTNVHTEGERPGDALKCVHHLDDPRGCGFGPHCRDCTVRKYLLDTIETGKSYDRREVSISGIGKNGTRRLTYLLSTTNIYQKRERLVHLALEDVTELKNREEELRKSEEKFRTIFENANDAIFIHDFEGHFLEVNEVACRSLGYTREELLQKSVEDIEVPSHEKVNRERMNAIEREGGTFFESLHRRKDGTEIPVEVNSSRFEYEHSSCVLSVVRDITGRKRAQENLRMFRNQLLTILEHQEVGVFVLSLETGKILFANSYMKRQIDSDMIGHRCQDVLGYKEEMCTRCPNRLVGAGDGSSSEPVTFFEYQLPSADRWFMAYVRPITWVDNSQATINIFSDITPYKEAERLRDDIDRITRHDLKSPLNGILGAVQVLSSEESLPEKYREYASIIEESGRNMLRLIDESLSLYKMETGTYELEPVEVDVEELLHSVVHNHEQLPEARGAQVLLENRHTASNRHDTVVRGEYLLCYSLFSNLIKNAIEASEEQEAVRVQVHRDSPQWISISVWNRKPLPREIRENFGGKYVTHGKKRGTGLGLYSARLMAEIQGGTISWSSSEEGGTRITVTLPAARAS